MKKKAKKKPSISYLKKKADKVFSELIRRTHCPNGYGQCVSCGSYLHWTEGDAGHFCSRKHNATRYDKRNVQFQCRVCNRWQEGRKYEFGKYLIDEYGEGIIDELNKLAHTNKRFTVDELKEMIEQFKLELKGLENV